MCAIFSFIKKGIITAEELEKIKEQFYRLQHRGPDHTSFEIVEKWGYTVFLGFHRLSIVGLSEQSNDLLQDDGVYLTCNGEIYNYKSLIKKYNLTMRTDSDCEVILQLYRLYPDHIIDILKELDGVFAFVLYDSNRRKIIASRDRIGVRPLFASADMHESISFASEGKALDDLTTPFHPGHVLIKTLGGSGDIVNWVPEPPRFNAPYTVAKDIIKELLIESVKKRLISDRPIGFLVSGGLDSSLVASIAQKLLNKPITTFSIGIKGSPDLVAARKVADFLQSEHHEIIITTEDILHALPDVIHANESFDITTTRASIPMYLIAKYIRENTDIKVIFSGEGADELFGGYLYFHNAPSPKEFQNETVRLLKELYRYDVLRADRTTAVWGLELRVPFLDADLLQYVTGIDPQHKMPSEHGIEKAIIRHAFDGYLPESVLYRQKEAFSDGVGYSSVHALKEYAISCDEEVASVLENFAQPVTPEARMYYRIFCDYYNTQYGLYTEKYWMPRWFEDVTDPSATVLNVHKSRG